MDRWQSILDDVLNIEKELGAGGESKIEPADGYFCNPCPESKSNISPFGDPRDENDPGGLTHKGNDLSAPEGTPIYACADGEVIDADYDMGQVSDYGDNLRSTAGRFLKIKHADGFVSTYMHCSKVFVPKGYKVQKGDNIALVGATGNAESPHLHWQVEKDGNAVDGMELLKPNPDLNSLKGLDPKE